MLTRSKFMAFLLACALAALLSAHLAAQSLTTGDIAGTVKDPSGAVVPNLTVNLRSTNTGATQTTATSLDGAYRFTLLKPGHYIVSVSQSGFQTVERGLDVSVGQLANADLTLQVGATTETVQVSEEIQLVSTEASMNTAFTQAEVAQLPSPGSDITNIAQTVAGAVMNVTGGYGNFTINGLPATSNMFT